MLIIKNLGSTEKYKKESHKLPKTLLPENNSWLTPSQKLSVRL